MHTTHRSILAVISASMILGVSASGASGPAAVYAIVDKVVLEPNEKAPERIQVWGMFSIWDAKASDYSAPERGYLYFAMPGPNDQQRYRGDVVRSVQIASYEWRDLKTVAGTGSAVAFAERGYFTGRLRKAGDTPAAPDVYPLYNGITQLPNMDNVGPGVIAKLKEAVRRK
jgi:hypothetical protein